MAKSILAIGSFIGFDKATNDIIVTSNSLSTAGLDLAVTMEEVRAGLGNVLQGFMPHTTSFSITAEDALFDLNYMALNCGGNITASADVITTENITTTVANTITVSQTPVAMAGNVAVVGWYKLTNATDDAWTTITFTGNTATVAGLASGSEVCVKYFYADASAREFTVSTNFVPKIIRAVVTYTLYATSQSATGSTAKIGELVIEIPNFQFTGAQSYSVSASGLSTSPIGGMALATYTGACNGAGYYALVKEVITGKDPFANAVKIGVADGDIDLAVSGTETIQVYAFYNDGTAPSKIDNSLLTFTSGTTATCTVGANTGLVTAIASGVSTITVVVSTKTSLSTTATVTVA